MTYQKLGNYLLQQLVTNHRSAKSQTMMNAWYISSNKEGTMHCTYKLIAVQIAHLSGLCC